MTTKKLTKRDLYNMLFVVVAESDAPDSDKELLCDFVNHELHLLEKKSKAHKVPTKTQIENQFVKTEILDAIAGGFTRAGEIAARCDISVQKASALLRQLVLSGDVERVEDGKVTYFMLKE